jgi:MFS family permease
MEAIIASSVVAVDSSASENEITAIKRTEQDRKNSDEVKESPDPVAPDNPKESSQDEDTVSEVFPEGGLQAWLCVLGSFLLLLPSFGLMVSVGTLQDYWHEHQLKAYTPRDIGWIPSVYVYLALGLSIWVGPLFDRYGPRVLTIVGSILHITAIFALAECKKYWQFMLCLGILGGISGALITTAGLVAVSHWFDKRRGRATGVAMIGNTVGGTIIPLILRATFPRYGWAWSIRILGFIMLALLLLGNVFVKGRLKPTPLSPARAKKSSMMSFHLFADARFTFLAISVFGIEIVLFGCLGILPTFASTQGYPPAAGFYLISVMNGVSCLGRFLPGFLSDYAGRFNTLLLMIFLTLVVMLVLWLPFGATNLTALYIFTAFFGFGTGSWMALVPVCIGQLCRAEEFGRYWGTCYFVASLATLVCVPIGGELVVSVGPQAMVGFFCAVLFLSMLSFALSRWACLGWKWRWRVKI